MAGVAKAFPRCFLGNQTYSCGDSSGISPDSLLIPRTEMLGLETKIDVNNVQFKFIKKDLLCIFLRVNRYPLPCVKFPSRPACNLIQAFCDPYPTGLATC